MIVAPHATVPIVSRGFACPVARPVGMAVPGGGGVAIAVDGTGTDRCIAITLRHADGTVLTAYLSHALLDRYAHLLAAAVEDDLGAPIGGMGCVR